MCHLLLVLVLCYKVFQKKIGARLELGFLVSRAHLALSVAGFLLEFLEFVEVSSGVVALPFLSCFALFFRPSIVGPPIFGSPPEFLDWRVGIALPFLSCFAFFFRPPIVGHLLEFLERAGFDVVFPVPRTRLRPSHSSVADFLLEFLEFVEFLELGAGSFAFPLFPWLAYLAGQSLQVL
jgi:hypothetical protein